MAKKKGNDVEVEVSQEPLTEGLGKKASRGILIEVPDHLTQELRRAALDLDVSAREIVDRVSQSNALANLLRDEIAAVAAAKVAHLAKYATRPIGSTAPVLSDEATQEGGDVGDVVAQ